MPSPPPPSREGSPRPRLAPDPERGPGSPGRAERPAGPSQEFGSPSSQILLPHPLEKLIWELGNEGFLFSFLPSLLLIFCKAPRGVAPSEATLRRRRGAQLLHQGTAPARSGRPGTPTAGRGRTHRAELASPGRWRLPEAGLVREEGWLPGLRDGDRREGRAAGPGLAKGGPGPGIGGVGSSIGTRGPGRLQRWQRLSGGVSEDCGGALGSRIRDTGQAGKVLRQRRV